MQQGTDSTPARIRSVEDFDFSKAKASCRKCNGTGIVGHLNKDGQRIPIVCNCVEKNGGVRADALDKHHARLLQAVKDGTFVARTAKSLSEMPEADRAKAINAYRERLDTLKDPTGRDLIIRLLAEVEKE
jgi:hypothetical protein